MLLNEYYKIQLNLSNNHDEVLQNVTVKVSLPASYKNKGNLRKTKIISSNIKPIKFLQYF